MHVYFLPSFKIRWPIAGQWGVGFWLKKVTADLAPLECQKNWKLFLLNSVAAKVIPTAWKFSSLKEKVFSHAISKGWLLSIRKHGTMISLKETRRRLQLKEADSLQGSNHFWVVLLEAKLILSGHQKNVLLLPSTKVPHRGMDEFIHLSESLIYYWEELTYDSPKASRIYMYWAPTMVPALWNIPLCALSYLILLQSRNRY